MDWQSHIRERQGPLYVAICDAIASFIASKELTPGQKLPPHRDLAYRLGVTVGTVAQAYAQATERGLVVGEVGRGTFVVDTQSRGEDASRLVVEENAGTSEVIDLGLNLSAIGDSEQMLHETLQEISERRTFSDLLKYQPAIGMLAHREAAADWLSRLGLITNAGSVAICNGGQHGVLLSFMAVARAGETIAVERLTYPGAKAAAYHLGINLAGVAMDEQGILPDALRELCRVRHPKALYIMPVLQNPTTSTSSERRLAQIAAVAEEHDLWVIEDDVYGFLAEDRPNPISTLIPSRTIYITSASKSMAPGLRVGFMHAPDTMIQLLQELSCVTNWMTPPLLAEVVANWIRDGKADRLIRWHRKQAKERQEIAHRWLSGHARRPSAASYHLWLSLPDEWRMDSFAVAALRQGVRVITSDVFASKRDHAPHAVRLCLGAAFSPTQIETAMRKLSALINNTPRPRMNLDMVT